MPTAGVWTFFNRLAQARLSRRLEEVAGDPSAPGSHRCRGRNRDRDRFRLRIVVGPHALRPGRHTRSRYGSDPVSRVQTHILSFDSDTDPDPDPDYNPCPHRILNHHQDCLHFAESSCAPPSMFSDCSQNGIREFHGSNRSPQIPGEYTATGDRSDGIEQCFGSPRLT
jgi:hypothetical protein